MAGNGDFFMNTQRKKLIIAGIEKRRLEKKRRRMKRKITALVTLAAICTVSFGAVYNASAKEITVTEINEFEGTNETVVVKTRSESVGEVIEQSGYTVGELDKLNKPADEKVSDNDDIVIKRGKQITIKSNDTEQVANITTANAADALVEAGFIPGEYDEITTDGGDLSQSSVIELVSVNTVEETEESEIKYQTEYIEDSSMAKGQTKVVSEGQTGVISTTYKVLYKNGSEVSREAMSEDVVIPVKNKVIAKGTAQGTSKNAERTVGAAKSDADTGKTINGMVYSKKITMTATAYSTSPSENGGYSVSAMGNPLGFGIVAVDPSVVPLGSKVYIEGADGSWSYGVASAEDTGGAIKGNKIDLCYNGSVSQVNKFGRRSCNVYILK